MGYFGKTKKEWSAIAKKAWKTRRANLQPRQYRERTGQVYGKCPYSKCNEPVKYRRWYLHMKLYGRELTPAETHHRKAINGQTNPYEYQSKEYMRWRYLLKCLHRPPTEQEMNFDWRKTHRKPVPAIAQTDAQKPRNPYSCQTEYGKYEKWRTFNKKHGRPPTEEEMQFRARVKQIEVKNYDAPKKNRFREMIVRSFSELEGNCLALESEDFLFSKQLPKLKFLVYENNSSIYGGMLLHPRPENVELRFGNVSKAADDGREFSCAFLDFCKSLNGCVEEMRALRKKLGNCKKIALTFSLRTYRPDWRGADNHGDYRFSMSQKVLSIFRHFKIEYASSYRDGCPMVGLILSQKKRYIHSYSPTIAFAIPKAVHSEFINFAKREGKSPSQAGRYIFSKFFSLKDKMQRVYGE